MCNNVPLLNKRGLKWKEGHLCAKCNLCDEIKTGRVSDVFLEVDMYVFTLCHTAQIHVHEYIRTYVQMSRVHLLRLLAMVKIDITRNTSICMYTVCMYVL